MTISKAIIYSTGDFIRFFQRNDTLAIPANTPFIVREISPFKGNDPFFESINERVDQVTQLFRNMLMPIAKNLKMTQETGGEFLGHIGPHSLVVLGTSAITLQIERIACQILDGKSG